MAAVEWDACWTDAAHTLSRAGVDPFEVIPLAELIGAGARRPSWWSDAACRGMAELFFDTARQSAAAAVCASCPVIGPCEAWAREQHASCGVWAGHTVRPPKALRLCPLCDRPAPSKGLCSSCCDGGWRRQAASRRS